MSAVKWSAASTAARFVLQMAAQVVLARTLGPDVFGIFAIGMVVLTFAAFFSNFGFSTNLVLNKTLSNQDIRFAWTWQVIVGIVTMLAVYLLAPVLAGYFREPRAQPVIEWLSLACFLTAAAAPASTLLQRDLNFRAIGLIQVVSYAVGYLAIGVPMALWGWGTYSLVAAWLSQAVVALIAKYALKPHHLRPLLWYRDGASVVGVGRSVFLTNIVNWCLNNMDRILIGRLLNAYALGLYNVAYNVATMPNSLLLGALQPAFLSAGSRLQDERQRLGSAYVQMVAVILVLLVPAFIFLALIASDLVHLLYGQKWIGAAWVLKALFLAMPAYVIWGVSTPILWNTGRRNHEFALQLPILVCGAFAFYFFAGHGIRAVAVIAALLLVLRAIVIGCAALRALQLSWRSLMPHALRGLVLSVLCLVTVLPVQHMVARLLLPLVSLIACSLAACVVFALLLVTWPRILGEQTTTMVLRFFPWLGWILNRGVSQPLAGTAADQRLEVVDSETARS